MKGTIYKIQFCFADNFKLCMVLTHILHEMSLSKPLFTEEILYNFGAGSNLSNTCNCCE